MGMYFRMNIYTTPWKTFVSPGDTIDLSNYTLIDSGYINYFTSDVSQIPIVNGSADEILNYCESLFGSDAFSMYIGVAGLTGVENVYILERTKGLLKYFPSFAFNMPNAANIIQQQISDVPPYPGNDDNWYNTIIHFPDLGYANLGGIQYKMNGNIGTVTTNEVFVPSFSSSSNRDIIMPIYTGYTKGDDITDVSRWLYATIRVTDYARDSSFLKIEKPNTTQLNAIISMFTSDTEPVDPPRPVNPYDPIDPSGPGGGDGTFDFDSDPVPLPPIPTLSSSNTGFTRIFNPTLSQVKQLANYLWTDESFLKTVWNQIKQVFDNPISAIIAFNLVPVSVPDAGNVEFKLMYIPTGVTMNVAASQFVDVDCGTLTVERVYGSALDYSPYTKISCFLPFVGTVTLNTDEVMNRTLQVKYRVDICSGACVAVILVDGTVMYQFTGHCAINIPMNGADFSTYVSALTAAAKIGLGAATGAGLIGAAAGVPEVTQTTSQTSTRKTERNPETGRQITSWTKDVQRNVEETVTKASHDGLTPANVANTVGSVMGSKPYIERSGSFTGNSGYLGVRRPYLIIERPNLCMPANFQSLNGFPAMMTLPLSSCKGFTRVQQVQLTKCTATNPEQAEILEFLKAGVYL